MRTSNWILCLWGLGLISLACVDDRPVYIDTGAGGTTGTGGTTGVAGTGFVTGAAGTGSVTGAAGTAGIVQFGCDTVDQVFAAHSCALDAACHDAKGTSANFSLGGLDFTNILDWNRRLVGVYPKGGGTSLCGASPIPYLIAGSMPAQGLLLDKLRKVNPVCGERMPVIPPDLTADELDCIQRWANEVTGSLLPAFCTIECPANTYCRNLASHYRDPGSFSCVPLPASCNGTPSCDCIRPVQGCFACQDSSDYIRCLAAG
jgi:hypothetical protein